MAIKTNFQNQANVTVNIGTEVTMGTICLTDDGTWNSLDCTNISFTEKKVAPLEIAPQKSGLLTQGTHQAKHAKDKRQWEVTLEFLGSPLAINRMCLAMYGDGDGTNALLGAYPTVKKYEHGVTNAIPVTIYLQQGGSRQDSSSTEKNKDLYFKSCLMSNLSFNYGFSDGGALKCSATFVTMYPPIEQDHVATLGSGSGSLTSTAGTPLNFLDVDTMTLASNDLLLHDFSLDISRSINSAGYDKVNEHSVGAVVGQYEVTGTLTCKRDDNSGSVEYGNSASQAIVVTQGASDLIGFAVPYAMIEGVTVDTADSWKQAISYRGFYDGVDLTSSVCSIKTA